MIVGLDVATRTGIAFGLPGATPHIFSKRFRESPTDTVEDVFGRALLFWAGFLRDHPVDMVAIEAPIRAGFGRTNHDTTVLTLGLYSIFAGAAHAKGIGCLRVEVATWRAFFLGTSKLGRKDAKREALRRCGYLGWKAANEDEADAAGIWAHACNKLDPRRAHRVEPLFTRAAE